MRNWQGGDDVGHGDHGDHGDYGDYGKEEEEDYHRDLF